MPSIFRRQLAVPLVLLILLSRIFSMGQTHDDSDSADNLSQDDFSTVSKFGPIDAVYTWVNGSDPVWKSERDFWYQRWIQEYDGPDRNIQRGQRSSSIDDEDASAENHFRDNDELRYSIRSLEKYAPWIRQIHLVTNGQVPSWLDPHNPRIKIVTHSEIFENSSHLPVFSSSSIESNLDRIPGLSDTFLYFNDDVFLNAPISLDDYITPSGVQTIYLSHPVPLSDDAYPEYWSGGNLRAPDCPEEACGWEFDDYSFSDDGRSVKLEQLVGKAYVSSACEPEAVIPQSLFKEVLGSNFTLEHGHISLTSLSTDQSHTSNNVEVSNTTKSMPELDTKSRIKIAALLDVLSQCPDDHDLVADAIRSVIQVFNRRFNLSKHLRRVPAHMPHMLNKQVLTELKGMFRQEFQMTSAHRFRHPRDLQVIFAYFNYLINRPYFLSSTLCELRDNYLDMGRDSWLKEDDIRSLESFLHGERPAVGFNDSVQSYLCNGSGFTNDIQFPSEAEMKAAVCFKDVERCMDMSMLRMHLQKEKGYRLKMGTDITFHMLVDDHQTVMDQLQSTREQRTKFICLNDDMKAPSIDVRNALRQLFEDLWPMPSSFELQTNPVGHNGGHRAFPYEGFTLYSLCLLTVLSGSTVIPFLLRIFASLGRPGPFFF